MVHLKALRIVLRPGLKYFSTGSSPHRDILLLFDMDGTLTPHRQLIKPNMEQCLHQVSSLASLGIVTGADITRIPKQIGSNENLKIFDYLFAENGLVAYKNGKHLASHRIVFHVGEKKIEKLIDFCESYLSELCLPVQKRGPCVEIRTGLVNICPIGRSFTQAEKEEFALYDRKHDVMDNFRMALVKHFADSGLTFTRGGQISLDAFPFGWDKRFCLQYVEGENFKEIHFFGDRTGEGGNDQLIYEDPRTIGHTVTSPEDTISKIKKLFGLN